eukprot:4307968-Prorocentrum_lima.AAC.1
MRRRTGRVTKALTWILLLLLTTAGTATNQERCQPEQPPTDDDGGSNRPTIPPLQVIDMMTMDGCDDLNAAIPHDTHTTEHQLLTISIEQPQQTNQETS